MTHERVVFDLQTNDNGCISLPAAERIQGITLYKGTSPQSSYVGLLYEAPHLDRCLEVRIPLLEALRLLNLLEAMSLDNGLDALRRLPEENVSAAMH
jgi:hypothetical protein